jgi:DNA-directed RNA polymerase specialized sigma subunit
MASEYLNNKTFEVLITRFQKAKFEQNKYKIFIEDIKSTNQRVCKRGKYKQPEAWAAKEKHFEKVNTEYEDSQKELAFAFYTLSQNIVRYAKFNLIDQDDAVQEGVMICFEKIDRFDPEKGKAFNYMTTCILNHFRQLYRTARNYNDLKKRYLDYIQLQMDQHSPPNRSKGIYKKHNISHGD